MAAQVDPSVTFDQVGGMEHHVRALKEMIFLPLVYPELFERFHISPPRGVLFYGPPGILSAFPQTEHWLQRLRSLSGQCFTYLTDVLCQWHRCGTESAMYCCSM